MAEVATTRLRTTWALVAALVISGGALAVVEAAQPEEEKPFCLLGAHIEGGHVYGQDPAYGCRLVDEKDGVLLSDR